MRTGIAPRTAVAGTYSHLRVPGDRFPPPALERYDFYLLRIEKGTRRYPQVPAVPANDVFAESLEALSDGKRSYLCG